jgi:hypothetical protein
MARLLALNTLLFLVPFAIYGAYLLATTRSLGGAAAWTTRIVVRLCVVGIVLVLVGLVVLVSFAGTTSNEPYHPAEIIDGQIVPGRFGDE